MRATVTLSLIFSHRFSNSCTSFVCASFAAASSADDESLQLHSSGRAIDGYRTSAWQPHQPVPAPPLQQQQTQQQAPTPDEGTSRDVGSDKMTHLLCELLCELCLLSFGLLEECDLLLHFLQR